jgi:hypothetical protein
MQIRPAKSYEHWPIQRKKKQTRFGAIWALHRFLFPLYGKFNVFGGVSSFGHTINSSSKPWHQSLQTPQQRAIATWVLVLAFYQDSTPCYKAVIWDGSGHDFIKRLANEHMRSLFAKRSM